jgi:cytochrome c peroxidase
MKFFVRILCGLLCFSIACNDSIVDPEDLLIDIPYEPNEYVLQIPQGFPKMIIPTDNPLTIDGVELGRRLFYDAILSSDGSMSCSSCHLPGGNFTDNKDFSPGVTGQLSKRSSMTLLNIGFVNSGLFWDGRVATLEEQALIPVEDPIELHDSWPNVESKLQNDSEYPVLFRKAFGIESKDEITKDLAVKAIAQFERTMISSGQSKYDRVINGLDVFSDEELAGHNIFFDIDPDVSRHAECGHCHNAPLFTSNEYFNNGIENVVDLNSFPDKGRGAVTGRLFDNGTFRSPTLRNIFQSAPYMHDGRFETIDEVLDHYATGGHVVDNIGAVLRPLTMTSEDRSNLKAFLKTLEDPVFIAAPQLQSPF